MHYLLFRDKFSIKETTETLKTKNNSKNTSTQCVVRHSSDLFIQC
jgi:hypothetical protein